MDKRQILIFRLCSIYVFATVLTCSLYSPKTHFFLLEYRKTNFPGLFCQNKNMEKVQIFDKNHLLTPFQKSTCLDFFDSLFYSLKRRFFFLEHHKTHFPGLFCPEVKGGKLSTFWPKLWTNPFAKIPVFRLLYLVVFIV